MVSDWKMLRVCEGLCGVLMTLLLILHVSPGAFGQVARIPDEASSRVSAPEACGSSPVISLTLVRPWQGSVELDRVRCLEITLEAGAFVRAAVARDGDVAGYAGFMIDLLAPGDSAATLRVGMQMGLSMGDRRAISWQAARGGSHFLILRDLWMSEEAAAGVPVRVWIESVESPAQSRARHEALARDPRGAWLRDNAIAVRSISPDDADFSDLQPLSGALEGVRMVLLGEADHASGSDFLAKSRLVKFLHQELGFDVLAFESGLYGMAVAWDSIRAGGSARAAFVKGNFAFWSGSEQMQSLIAYVGEQALGDTPLEVAGFDNRPWLYWPDWHTPLTRFAEDLGRILRDRGATGPLADPGSPEYGVLERLSARRYYGAEPLPDPPARVAFLRALNATVAELEASADADARFWAEALRGVGCHAREVFVDMSGAGELPPECLRDHQMGEHLIWLANERYPGRKIIAWAATAHVMRDPAFEQVGGTGPAMGQRVWEALGEESYAIGMTSYRSEANHIVPDQHPLPDFEQLMEVAGFEYAIVDLRRAVREGSWAGGPFPARPTGHLTEQRVWSDVLDALFFIRVQERRRMVDDR
jgi:erythromycin esterase